MLSAATNAYCSSSDLFAKATLDPLENIGKIEPKSMKNRAQGAQNPSRFDLAVPNPCQIVARSAQNRFLSDFGFYFKAQNGVEIHEFPLKFEEICDIVCTYKIMVIFHGF